MSINRVINRAPPMRFAQLGLLVGSFTSWQKDPPDQQSQRLENLMQWTLQLPGFSIGKKRYRPQLGISANGFALIYYTLLQAKKRESSLSGQQRLDAEKVKEDLIRLGISHSTLQQIEGLQTPYDRYTYPCFERLECLTNVFHKYAGNLFKGKTARPHFALTPRRSSYIWLDNEDSLGWTNTIKGTLNDLTRKLAREELDQSDVMRLGERLECCIFAPLDISQPFISSEVQITSSARQSEMQKEVHEAFQKMQKGCRAHKTPRYLYLSWDLLAFDYWRYAEDEKLLYRTILALWANWPRDEVWAPPRGLPEHFSSPTFSLEEATFLLTDVMRHVRRYFMEIKDAHKLMLSKQCFETVNQSRTCYPPTFYFADPIARLPTITAYVEDTGVRHLLSHCLGYDDPHADKLSWSTLEGSMATVRGEVVREDHYKPRYLLFPISDKLQSDKEINEFGVDIDSIVDAISLREYTIAMEDVKINDKKSDIVISDTGKIMDLIFQKLARVVPALSTKERKNCIEEFVPLQLALGRVQSALEETRKDATRLVQQYNAVIERTERFFDVSIIMASKPNLPPLSLAMKDAYPHQLLRQEMGEILGSIENLANNNERINSLLTLLSTVTSDNQRRRYERIGTLIAFFGVLFAAATLLVIPKVDILSILRTINTWGAGHVTLIVIIVVLLSLFFFSPLRRLLHKLESRKFHKCVQKFWKLAIYTTYSYKTEKGCKDSPALDLSLPAKFKERWNNRAGADKIDSDATAILQRLVSYLKSPSTGEDIVRNARRLIYTFVLYPERIPLPRTLCILRYKSLQYIGAPAIRNNDFRDSLEYAGFKPYQVEVLQSWLHQPENSEWIRDNSVETVAGALKNAGVTAHPSQEDVSNNWQKSRQLCTFSKESH